MRENGATGRVDVHDDHRLRAVEEVLGKIRRDLSRAHSLDDLAQTACFSPFHFLRVFRLITATTPARFLAALRIAEAKRLLAATDLDITTICMQVGYTSLGTFSHQFARHVGVSPRKFRRLITEMSDQSWDAVLDAVAPPPLRAGRARKLRVRFNGLEPGRIALVGLFESGIPQGWPAACAMARESAEVDMAVGPDGAYMALAMSFSPDADIEAMMTGDLPNQYLVGSYGHVHVEDGHVAESDIVIDLRPRRPSDPPIVFASPLLAAQESGFDPTPKSLPVGRERACAGSKKFRDLA
ncbi:helix-turn-helix domain-containing protein [Nonomuraea sp. 3-1Str]|uniref:helix-turn-helix domain-containing protein n=1 Tax=unclassified Nonomuraea TaxID=2593643 RepID=UPI00285C64BF|nr:helix-turn-helix domain-containing protein [Nonomuraea sp. 3-1Str]MDR8413106.1 helix-turn-helix domain-containing protein [Nonomuraea sp. 3-1Str]